MVTGSLQIKKNHYYVMLNLYENGKRKPTWVSTGLPVKGNKKRAEAMLFEVRAQYESEEIKAEPKEQSQLLFTELMSEWLSVAKNSLQQTTYGGYSNVVNNSIIPYFTPLNIKLIELDVRHIQGYYNYLFADRKVTANTVLRHHANIRKALQYALKMGLIDNNPADRIVVPTQRAIYRKLL